jgi:preprotein translocase subunit SecD
LAISLASICSAIEDTQKSRDIDVLGGVSFTLSVEPRVDADGAKLPVTPAQVDQTIIVIGKRLKGMGTADFNIARQGGNGIVLQLPGAKQPESVRIRAVLERLAKFELREVCPRNTETDAQGKSLPARVKEGLEIVPGYRVFDHKHKDADGKVIVEPILLNRRVALGGSDIALAIPSQRDANAVSVTLNGPGADKMIALTAIMRPGVDRVAIMLDGQVISAPVVQQVPLGKDFIIEGLNEPGEAETLANALMNPLEFPLKIDEMRTILPKKNK